MMMRVKEGKFKISIDSGCFGRKLIETNVDLRMIGSNNGHNTTYKEKHINDHMKECLHSKGENGQKQ